MGRKNGIEIEDLVREFRKGPRAVDGISLTVEPGEIYGFLGPNGAGKSTTVLMLTTLLPPTSGTARVAGYDIVREGPQVRASIGAALQEAALDPFLTGREHLRLHPDGRRIATIGEDHVLYLWDGVNDEPLWEYTSLSGKITEFRFSADSQRLLCLCNEDQLVILDGSPMEDRP
jgi:ABC-type multidrug transport system ATPase subunit